MPVVISLLRAVNVGGRNAVKMDALRALYQSVGVLDPRTYVQSGNVVFRTQERDLPRLAKRLENAFERTFGFRPEIIQRTLAELDAVIAANPFAARRDIEARKLLVMFLAGDPAREARDKLSTMKTDPDELRVAGREVYVYYPNGMGWSKLSGAMIEKALSTAGTGRNWNTVVRLRELAASLA